VEIGLTRLLSASTTIDEKKYDGLISTNIFVFTVIYCRKLLAVNDIVLKYASPVVNVGEISTVDMLRFEPQFHAALNGIELTKDGRPVMVEIVLVKAGLNLNVSPLIVL